MIASKVHVKEDDWNDQLDYLSARAATALLPVPGGDLHLIGLYVPSRDASLDKTERKRRWLDACTAALITNGHAARHTLLVGDLNILEPDHNPHYSFFAPFEYDFYRALLNHHGLVDAFRLNNGLLEGINSLVQAAKARARGYRNKNKMITIIYLTAAKLLLPTVTSPKPAYMTSR